MNDSKNSSGKSGFFSPFILAVAVLAIGATGAAIQLAPAAATSSVPATATYAGPTGYLPAEIVNQATEVEPMPAEYY
jgi:hypothetical protein